MTSEKLMMAILSLDAYSRSSDDLPEDVRIYGLGGTGAMLGAAKVSFVQNEPGSSFVAVAYEWDNKTVLAFRGTDNTGVLLDSDIWNGWSLGAGFDIASQAGLAKSFYEAMTGQTLFQTAPSDVILTGQYVGGGLAGYLSALNGATAYGFDHMVFGPGAERTFASHLHSLGISDPDQAQFSSLGLKLPNASNFTGTYVDGEILVGVRNGDFAGIGSVLAAALSPVLGPLSLGASWLLNALSQAQASYENNLSVGELSTFGWSLGSGTIGADANALHSQALLVTLLFAEESSDVGGQWASSGFALPLLNALYSDAIAVSAGILAGNSPTANISGKSNPADLMLTKIAYSALENGELPFGDSAIRSMFNDAEAVGHFLNDGGNSGFVAQTAANEIARFAALQAQHSIVGMHSGFLTYASGTLTLDFRQQAWTFGDYFHPRAHFYNRDFSTYLDDGRLDGIEQRELDDGPGRIEFEYYSNAAGGWHGQIGYESDLYTVKAVGTDTVDTIIGTDGDEQFILLGGDDKVKANGGVNWIDGGEGEDTLLDNYHWAQFDISYDSWTEQYYLALRNSGTDPRIHVVKNVELFKFASDTIWADELLNEAPTDILIDAFGGPDWTALIEGEYAYGDGIVHLNAV